MTPRRPYAPAAADFDAFWAAYPRRKNKQAAQDAFHWSFQHANDDGTLLARMLEAIQWQREEQPNAQFWVEPHRWLLARRWEDEPLPPVVVPATAQERRDYRQWQVSLGPHASGVTLDDYLARTRRTH